MNNVIVRRGQDACEPLLNANDLERGLWQLFGAPTRITPVSQVVGRQFSPVDVIEVGEQIYVIASLPGIDSSAVEIQFEDGVLTLSGQYKPVIEVAEGERVVHHQKSIRQQGAFKLSITLPVEVNADSAQATYVDGVLKVGFSRPESRKPRRITVNGGAQTIESNGSPSK